MSTNRTGTEDLQLISPTILLMPKEITNHPNFNALQKKLEYVSDKVRFVYLQWRQIQKQDDEWLSSDQSSSRHWFVTKFGRSALDQKVKDLDIEMHKTCLMKIPGGRYYTYSGLQKIVESTLNLKTIIERSPPTPDDWKLIPWAEEPFKPRWYQSKALDLLCPLNGSRTHGAVSIGTGLGKSLIMALIAKRIGLACIIGVPTKSIASQMIKDFSKWFGKGKVGLLGDGKKQTDKHILVAIGASLLRVEKGSEIWNDIASRKIVLCDESHTWAPDSLSTVMFDLLKDIPYRYFFSGTQFRTDGLGLLLQGITNDVVFDMSVREGIEGDFLSPLKFFQYRITSNDLSTETLPIKANQIHLRQNKNIYRHAAKLVNKAVKEKNRKVLVLIEEVGQFKLLLDAGLQVPAMFAHGGVTKDNKKDVPEAYWKSDPQKLVEEFDNNKFPVLVGTSCISMGTDIRSVDLIISIVGLSSEIEISQSVGRETRKFPGKKDSVYIDYDVWNNKITHRHAEKRRRVFDSIYGTCKIIDSGL